MNAKHVWRPNAKMTCKHCGKPITRKPPQNYKIDHTEDPVAYVHLHCWYWYTAEREDTSFIAEWFYRLESIPSDETIRTVLERTFKGWVDHYAESTRSQKELALGDLDQIARALVLKEYTMLWDTGVLQTQVYRHDHERIKGELWKDALDLIARVSPSQLVSRLDDAIKATALDLEERVGTCQGMLDAGYMEYTGVDVDLQVVILKTCIAVKETTEGVISTYPRWD